MAQRTSNNPEYKDLGSITAVLGCYEYEDAFDDTNQTTAPIALSTPAVKKVNRIHFKASRSSAIYGKSPTVQPSAISLIPQIRFQGGDNIQVLSAGLPNIEGEIAAVGPNEFKFGLGYGAFVSKIIVNSYGKIDNQTTNSKRSDGMLFDASKSNPLYGSSTTVQPPSIVLIPQLRYQSNAGWLDSSGITVDWISIATFDGIFIFWS